MKKILCLFLTVVFILLAGCGKKRSTVSISASHTDATETTSSDSSWGTASSSAVASQTQTETTEPLDFPLENAGMPGWEGITPKNYPRIGYTEFTESLTEDVFRLTFKPVNQYDDYRKHPLYPHQISTEKEISEGIISGNLDMAILDKFISDRDFDPELDYTLIGREALIFITAKDNPVSDISKGDLLKLMNQKTPARWSDFSNGTVACGNVNVAGQYAYFGGSQILSKTLLNGGQPLNSVSPSEYAAMKKGNTSGDMYFVLGKYSGNKGYVLDYAPLYRFLGYNTVNLEVVDEVHLIKIDGKEPLSNGKLAENYPYRMNIYVVQKKGTQLESAEIIKKFLQDDAQSQTEKMMFGGGVLSQLQGDFIIDVYKKLMKAG